MSTRSCIYVFGGQDGPDPFFCRLYRHSDGYPSANLATIAKAIESAGNHPKRLANKLLLNPECSIRLDGSSSMALVPLGDPLDVIVETINKGIEGVPEAAARIAGWTKGLEAHLRIKTGSPDGGLVEAGEAELADFPLGSAPTAERLGAQGDLEWIYFVDADKKNVNVYGGQWGVPTIHVSRGPADPMVQVEGVMPQFVDSERREVFAGMDAISLAGWTLNSAPLGIEAECEKDARGWKELEAIEKMLPRGMRLADPSEVPGPSIDGPILKHGEHWTLQRAAIGSGNAYILHKTSRIDAQALSEGQSYSIAYEGGRARAQPVGQSRPKGADLAR